MEISTARHLALAEMRKWHLLDGINPWKLLFSERTDYIGICYPQERIIMLSRPVVARLPQTMILDTVRHEIAHALEWILHKTGGHGPVWQRLAEQVGAEPVETLPLNRLAGLFPYEVRFDGEVLDCFFTLSDQLLAEIKEGAKDGCPTSKGKLELYAIDLNGAETRIH